MLPALGRATGYLPAGIHDATWPEFVERFAVTTHRRLLADGLLTALRHLRDCGCRVVIVDGSFVTAKRRPGDYDGVWNAVGVDEKKVDPVLFRVKDNRARMKAKYGGELFLQRGLAPDSEWLEFFMSDRDGNAKGVVRLDLRELP